MAIWLNSVGIQGHKDKKTVKKGQIWSFLANFDLVLPLKFWMPTDFNNLAYFGINNVQMNEKCWNRGVTFSSRTIFHFEQCATLVSWLATLTHAKEITVSLVYSAVAWVNLFSNCLACLKNLPTHHGWENWDRCFL